MARGQFQATARRGAYFLIAFMIVMSMQTARPAASPVCPLFEYYDPHMDSCGPCREICLNKERTGTEKQCNQKCSDYLVSLSCNFLQYYDENVGDCAPCSEVCLPQNVTSQDCSTKCPKYMIAQNCGDEEYYDETTNACGPCYRLCSWHDQEGTTTQDCFQKCPYYLDKIPPGHIMKPEGTEPPDSDTGETHQVQGSPGNSPEVHPRDIVVGISTLVVIALAVTVVVYWKKYKNYTRAPRDEPDNNEDGASGRGNDQVHLEMENMTARPVLQPSTPELPGGTEGANGQGDMKYSVQVTDHMASSAAAFNAVTLPQSVV